MVRTLAVRLLLLPLVPLLIVGCSRASPPEQTRAKPDAGDGPHVQVAVYIQGTPGVQFAGSMGEPGDTRSIRGQVPAQFTMQVRQSIFARVQKTGREGKMVVRLVVAGREVAPRTTEKPYGLITLQHPPSPSDR